MNNRNFGDIIGPYLAEKISGMTIQYANKNYVRSHFLTAGSILAFANGNSIIWGSGILSMRHNVKKPKRVCAVRGPKTRERLISLGIDCPDVYGDPALLLPRYYCSLSKNSYRLGIIPHYVDYEEVSSKFANEPVVKVVNLLDPLEKVVDDINSCERTVSSSLHGLIASHSYGIPSAWAKFSDKLAGDGTKFEDYFLSVNLVPYQPYDYSNNRISLNQVIDLIDRKHQRKIDIDLSKLMAACPFNMVND